MDAARSRLDSAMFQIDPNVVAINAKLARVREGSGQPEDMNMTPAEIDEFHADTEAALRANPDLVIENQNLQERFQAYTDKLHAAALKADPSIAPILAEIDAAKSGP